VLRSLGARSLLRSARARRPASFPRRARRPCGGSRLPRARAAARLRRLRTRAQARLLPRLSRTGRRVAGGLRALLGAPLRVGRSTVDRMGPRAAPATARRAFESAARARLRVRVPPLPAVALRRAMAIVQAPREQSGNRSRRRPAVLRGPRQRRRLGAP